MEAIQTKQFDFIDEVQIQIDLKELSKLIFKKVIVK